MMNLESQVVNLALSKRLKELGLKKESLFYWLFSLNKNASPYLGMKGGFSEIRHENDMINAYTASELLEMIPDYLEHAGCLKIEKHHVIYGEGITYFIEYGYGYYEGQDKNLCNALTKTLIHLIEKKIIEV